MTAPSTGPSPTEARVTIREVYDIVLEVRDSVAVVPSIRKDVDDHESRIRSLERKVWIAAGAAALLGVFGSKLAPFFAS